MKVSVSMTTEKDEFDVSSWWANSPDFVIDSLAFAARSCSSSLA